VRQNLVHLAREILKSSSREGKFSLRPHDAPAMSAVEDQAALAESPSSRFTAVNEKDSSTIVVSLNGHNTNGSASASNNGPQRPSPPDDRSKAASRMPPPGQEKLSITTTTTTTSPTHREEWISPPNGDRTPYPGATPYAEPESSHKRKRSGDGEQTSPSANSYHSHSLPSSAKQTPTTASTDDGPRDDSPRGQPPRDPRGSYNPDGQYRSFLASPEENREAAPGSDIWHSREYPQTHINSDEHLGEVLQRASQSLDAQQHHDHDYDQTSPGDDDRSGNPYSPYRDLGPQSDAKKRKRNFSNRTKTGCMTCRRRKKKCDEARPECKTAVDLMRGFLGP
jgi:hypothetical protein